MKKGKFALFSFVLAVILLFSAAIFVACGDKGGGTAPTLTYDGEKILDDRYIGDVLTIPAVTASDAEDGDISAKINVTVTKTEGEGTLSVENGAVQFLEEGEYKIVYSVTDSDGLQASLELTVSVYAREIVNTAPVITAPDKFDALAGESFMLEGISASDEQDGDLTSAIDYTLKDAEGKMIPYVSGQKLDLQAGRYTLLISVTDKGGLSDSKTVFIDVAEWTVAGGAKALPNEAVSFSGFSFTGRVDFDGISSAQKALDVSEENVWVSFYARTATGKSVTFKVTAVSGAEEKVLISSAELGGTSVSLSPKNTGESVTQENCGWTAFAVPLYKYFDATANKTFILKVETLGTEDSMQLCGFEVKARAADADADNDLSTITFDFEGTESKDGLSVQGSDDTSVNMFMPDNTGWYKGIFADWNDAVVDDAVNLWFAKNMQIPEENRLQLTVKYGSGGDAGVLYRITATDHTGGLYLIQDWKYHYNTVDGSFSIPVDAVLAGKDVTFMVQFRATNAQGGTGEQWWLDDIRFEKAPLNVNWVTEGGATADENAEVRFSYFSFTGLAKLAGANGKASKTVLAEDENAYLVFYAKTDKAESAADICYGELKVTARCGGTEKTLIDWHKVGGTASTFQPMGNGDAVTQINNGWAAYVLRLDTYFSDYLGKEITFIFETHQSGILAPVYITGFDVFEGVVKEDSDGDPSKIDFAYNTENNQTTEGIVSAANEPNYFRPHDPNGTWYTGRFDDNQENIDQDVNVWFSKEVTLPQADALEMAMFAGGDGQLFRVTGVDEEGNFYVLLDWTYRYAAGDCEMTWDISAEAAGKTLQLTFQFRDTNVQGGIGEQIYIRDITFRAKTAQA